MKQKKRGRKNKKQGQQIETVTNMAKICSNYIKNLFEHQ